MAFMLVMNENVSGLSVFVRLSYPYRAGFMSWCGVAVQGGARQGMAWQGMEHGKAGRGTARYIRHDEYPARHAAQFTSLSGASGFTISVRMRCMSLM